MGETIWIIRDDRGELLAVRRDAESAAETLDSLRDDFPGREIDATEIDSDEIPPHQVADVDQMLATRDDWDLVE